MDMHEDAYRCVVQVSDGRGFVVEGDSERYVITAAHCLPTIPPAMSFSFTEERTYQALLCVLGAKPTVWAECVFVDPVADIAVLAKPDDQAYPDQADRYEELVNAAMPIEIRPCQEEEQVWTFALDGTHWFSSRLRGLRSLWLTEATERFRGGMSGSPILGNDGKAIGVFVTSDSDADDQGHLEGGPQPGLAACLPGWLLDDLAANK
jgi:hypothetical protein